MIAAALFAIGLANWNSDLDVLARELPKLHPNAFHATSRETFEAAIARLRERAASLPPHVVAMEIARIVTAVGDGHTRLTLPIDPNAAFFLGHTTTKLPDDPDLRFHHLPIRFYSFDDGLFVRAAERRELIGRRVLRIGDKTAEEAMAAVEPFVSGDNELGKRLNAGDYLAVPEVLHAAGVISAVDVVPIVVDNANVTLAPLPFGAPALWLPKDDPRAYHFELRGRIVHFVFNEVKNERDETFAAFVDRLMRFIDTHDVDALVIDIRNNPGGNGALNQALVHAIIRSRKLRQPGRLFVLIGRRTFSAAGFLVTALEQNSNALFVGEPTGAAPNGWGDSRKLTLPSSGLTVRVSTLYWQPSDPRDPRKATEPHIVAPPLSADIVSGRDNGFEAVRAFVQKLKTRGTTSGTWKGTVRLDFQYLPLQITNGRVICKEIDLDEPIDSKTFDLRIGDGVLTGTMKAEGREFLVFATR
jgi:hypothetical protein